MAICGMNPAASRVGGVGRVGRRRRGRRNMSLVPACGGQAFPPARPREVNKILGDTPRPPSEGACPLCTPPGLCQVIWLMTIRLGRRARCPPYEGLVTRASGSAFHCGVALEALDALCGVGVLAGTWASLFPPTRPREVNEILGDTPRPPAERGSPSPPKADRSAHSPFFVVDEIRFEGHAPPTALQRRGNGQACGTPGRGGRISPGPVP